MSNNPIKNKAYTFSLVLPAAAGGGFQIYPTLATGDVKVKTDDGSYANITTLPTATSGQPDVKVSLSAGEMNGDSIKVWFKDAAGAEWLEAFSEIKTELDLTNLYYFGQTITTGKAITGTLTTTSCTTDLTNTTDNYYGNADDGAVIVWLGGNNDKIARRVTGYNGTTKLLSYEALPVAPSNNDAFIITGRIETSV